MAGVSVSLEGSSPPVANSWTSFTNGSLTITGGIYDLPKLTDADGSSLDVQNGATLTLPNLTQYAANSSTFQAEGTSSLLDVSALKAVTEPGGWNVVSYSGGNVDLSALTSISSTNQSALSFSGGSTIQAGKLTTLDGVGVTLDGSEPQISDSWTTLTNGSLTVTPDGASNPSATLPALTDADQSSLIARNGVLSLPALTSYSGNGTFDATDGTLDLSAVTSIAPTSGLTIDLIFYGKMNLTGLTSLTSNSDSISINDTGYASSLSLSSKLTVLNGINVTLSGDDAHVADDWTTLTHGTLTVTGGSYTLPALTDVDDSSLYASSGGSLSLPNLTKYDGNGTFSADGARSGLSLLGLTTITQSDGSWTVSGINQGDLLLYGLTTLAGTAFHTLTATFIGGVFDHLATLDSVNLTFAGPPSSGWISQPWTDFTNSVLTIKGNNVDLDNLTNANGSSFAVDSGGNLSLPSLNTYTGGGTFSADGTGSTLDASALTVVTVQGAWSVTATNGGTVNVTDLGHVTSTAATLPAVSISGNGTILDNNLTNFNAVALSLDGTNTQAARYFETFTNGTLAITGGSYNLPALTDADGSSIYVSNGASLSLGGLAAYKSNNTTFSADGTGSLLDVSALVTVTQDPGAWTISATKGGTVNLSGLTSLANTTSIAIDATSGGTIDLNGLTSINGTGSIPPAIEITDTGKSTIEDSLLSTLTQVGITLDGTDPQVADAWTMVADSILTINGGSFNLPHLTNIDGSTLSVSNGASLALPSVKSDGATSDFSADGAGSMLDLSALATEASYASISATHGATINLSSLTAFPGNAGLSWVPWSDTFTDTDGSTVLDGEVTSLVGIHATLDGTDIHVADSWASFTDGALNIGGGSYTLADLSDFDGSSVALSNGGSLALPKLASFDAGNTVSASTFQIDSGSSLDLSALTQAAQQAAWWLNIGGTVDLSSLTSLDGTKDIFLNDGGDLLDGKLTRLDGVDASLDASSSSAAATWKSLTDGKLDVTGGVVDLPGLTDVDGSSLLARNGATLSLPALVSYATGGEPDNSFQPGLFYADGAGSKLNVSALTDVTQQQGMWTIEAQDGGTIGLSGLKSLSGSAALPLSVGFTGNGTIDDGHLATLDHVDVTLDGTNTQATSPWTALTNGSITVIGGIYTLVGVSSIDGTSLDVENGATLAFPSITSYTPNSNMFRAIESGSVIDLSALTSVGQTTAQWNLIAVDGGEINLNGLASLAGTNRNISIEDEYNGTLLDSHLSNLAGVSIAIDGSDAEVASAWRTVVNSDVTVSSGSYTLPGLTDIDGSSLSVERGGGLSLPGLENYAANGEFSADGAGSLLDLSALSKVAAGSGSWSVNATDGAEIKLSGLTKLAGNGQELFDISFSGNGNIADGNLTSFNGVAVTLDGSNTQVANPWTTLVNGSLTVTGGAFSLLSLTDVDNSSLLVSNGATLALPSLTSCLISGTFQATGPGSVLDVSALVTVAPGQNVWTVNAANGGVVNLTGLTSITNNGPTLLQAAFTGNSTILDANLKSLEGVAVTLDGTNTQVADFWGSITNGSLTITGGSYNLQRLTGLDGSSVLLSGGASLTLPALVDYVSNGTTFTADGPGSSLNLPALTTLTGTGITVTAGAGATVAVDDSSSDEVTNEGALDLADGSTLNIAGSFTNSGNLSVNAGAKLSAGGDFTQTQSGALNLQIADTPASGQFGQIVTQRKATLNGGLAAEVAAGFSPQPGEDFKVIAYTSVNGNFATVSGLGSNLVEVIGPTSVDLIGDDRISAPLVFTLSMTEGATFTGTLATFSGSDPSGSAADFRAQIAWGDGVTTAGTISGTPLDGYSVGGHHIYAEAALMLPMSVVVQDQAGMETTINSTASISDASLTPHGATITATEGTTFTSAVGSFSDANPLAKVGDFTATIAWGDGTTAAGTVAAAANDGFNVTGSHAYTVGGNETMTVIVRDVGGSAATINSVALVNDASLTPHGATITAAEGTTFTGAVASFSDANPLAKPGGFTATTDWGDGVSSTGTVSAATGGGFNVIGSHVYAEDGNETITVTIHDAAGSTVTVLSTAAIADASLTPQAASIANTEGSVFNGNVASFSDGNPLATAADFTVTIDWGDSQTSTGTVTAATGGGFNVSGSHAYAEDGTETLTITIHDAGGSTATATSQVTVAEATTSGSGITLTSAQATTLTAVRLATFTHGDGSEAASDFAAAIDWGDGHTSAGTVSEANGTYRISGSHAYVQSGTFAITTTVADDGVTSSFNSSAIIVSPHSLYVTAVYEVVLGRAPDTAGLAYWTGLLDQGAAISSVADAIAHSAEYYANFVIKPDYLNLLGRLADAAGVAYWTSQMQTGLTDQQLEADLVSSQEFFQAAGGTNADWIDAIYKLLLGRPADPDGTNYWLGQLSGGALLNAVAQQIAGSQENDSQLINDDYFHYLGRSADAVGISYWLAQFAAGETNENIIAGFTGSSEYFDEHSH